MTNLPHLIETALLILVAFLIGCVMGYFLRRIFTQPEEQTGGKQADAGPAASPAATAPAAAAPKTTESRPAAPKNTATKTAATKAAASKPAAASKSAAKPKKSASAAKEEEGRPAGLDAPRGGKKDNLKQIKGIGPKIEGQLNELGIYHIDQIAEWDRKTIQWVDGYLSFKGRIDREKWVPQAKEMAK